MYKTIIKTSLILISLFFSLQGADAAENTLHSIQVLKSFDGYHLTLQMDKLADFAKKVESENRVYFELDNVRPEKDLKTTYKNTGNIDGVVIQQNGSKMRIYLSAKGAKESNLTFETPGKTIVTESAKEARESLPNYIFFGIIGILFFMFQTLLSKIKKEGESGYANKLLKQDSMNIKNHLSDIKTKTTNPIYRGSTTIKLIEQNRELYAKERKTA